MRNLIVKLRPVLMALVVGIAMATPAYTAPTYTVTTGSSSNRNFDAFLNNNYIPFKDNYNYFVSTCNEVQDTTNARISELEAKQTPMCAFRWSLPWNGEVANDVTYLWRGYPQKVNFSNITSNYSKNCYTLCNTNIWNNYGFVVPVRGLYTFDVSVNIYDIQGGSAATLSIMSDSRGAIAIDARRFENHGSPMILSVHTTALLNAGETVYVTAENPWDPFGSNAWEGFAIGGPGVANLNDAENKWISPDVTYFAGRLVSAQ